MSNNQENPKYTEVTGKIGNLKKNDIVSVIENEYTTHVNVVKDVNQILDGKLSSKQTINNSDDDGKNYNRYECEIEYENNIYKVDSHDNNLEYYFVDSKNILSEKPTDECNVGGDVKFTHKNNKKSIIISNDDKKFISGKITNVKYTIKIIGLPIYNKNNIIEYYQDTVIIFDNTSSVYEFYDNNGKLSKDPFPKSNGKDPINVVGDVPSAVQTEDSNIGYIVFIQHEKKKIEARIVKIVYTIKLEHKIDDKKIIDFENGVGVTNNIILFKVDNENKVEPNNKNSILEILKNPLNLLTRKGGKSKKSKKTKNLKKKTQKRKR
jgi:hypothetical protein